MNRLVKFFLTTFLLAITGIQAQVGVGTRTPNPDAMLEVSATNKGLLLPRIALTSSTAASPLSAHVVGMTVFNTANVADVSLGYYYNDGSKWIKLSTGVGAIDATPTANGLIRLTGDLTGTAALPSVANLAINTAKLADDAVTSAKILNANVTEAKLADSAVTTSKILDANVTIPKISATGTADATTFLRGDGVWTENASVLKGTVNTDGAASMFTISNTKILPTSIVTVSYQNTANEIINHAITSITAGGFTVQFAAAPANGGKILYTVVN